MNSAVLNHVCSNYFNLPDLTQDLTPIILQDSRSLHGLYCIPGPRTGFSALLDNYYRIVYPLDELCQITGWSYDKTYGRFYRKNGILFDPTTRKKYCLICTYYENIADAKYYVLDQITSTITLQEDDRLKNFFGHLTPVGLNKLFPWIDFTISDIKLLYLPFLIPVIVDERLHYILFNTLENVFGIDLTVEDFKKIYEKTLINKEQLGALRDISVEYARKIMIKTRIKTYVKGFGLGRTCFFSLKECMEYEEFLGYAVQRYDFEPRINLRNVDIIFPQVRNMIIEPLRKNIDLRISLMRETIQNTRRLEYDNVCTN